MKRGAAFLAVLTLLSFAAAAANAQVGMPDGTRSCFQISTNPAAATAPVVTFGGLGWNLILSGRANRLILALAQWHPMPGRTVSPLHVRGTSEGQRGPR